LLGVSEKQFYLLEIRETPRGVSTEIILSSEKFLTIFNKAQVLKQKNSKDRNEIQQFSESSLRWQISLFHPLIEKVHSEDLIKTQNPGN